MYELLTEFDWLADEVTTTNQRLAVTFAAVGFFLFVIFSYRDLQAWLSERLRVLYADIITTVVLVGSGLLTGLVTLGVWRQTETARDLFAEANIGGEVVAKLIFSFILFVMTYIIWRFLKRVLHDVLASSSAVTDHQEEISHRIVQVGLWSTALIVVLGVWVDDVSGLLVGAGFLGIVVGMAARQTLGSMLAGFVLMFSRPFEIGDWIEVDDRQGIVTDISIFNTRVQSFDGEYIMIPNDVISSSMVTNRSKKGRLRVEIDIGIDYDDDIDEARDLAREAIDTVEEAMDVPQPQVIVKAFGDSAVVCNVRFWIDRPSARRFASARTNAIREIKSSFDAAGVTIPYPQRALSNRPVEGEETLTDEGHQPPGVDAEHPREESITHDYHDRHTPDTS